MQDICCPNQMFKQETLPKPLSVAGGSLLTYEISIIYSMVGPM